MLKYKDLIQTDEYLEVSIDIILYNNKKKKDIIKKIVKFIKSNREEINKNYATNKIKK